MPLCNGEGNCIWYLGGPLGCFLMLPYLILMENRHVKKHGWKGNPTRSVTVCTEVKRLKMGTKARGWVTNTFVITRSDCGVGTCSSVSQRKSQQCEGVGSGRRNLLCKEQRSEPCRHHGSTFSLVFRTWHGLWKP